MSTYTINYGQCWEDPLVVLQALDISSDDNVLTITSGGENVLALLAENPKSITSVDSNPSQNHIFELKLEAIRQFKNNRLLKFLGIKDSKTRQKNFNKIAKSLNDQAYHWLRSNKELISRGVIHVGKFERFLRFYYTYLLPISHSKETVQNFISLESLTEQQRFFDDIWNSWSWRTIFMLASSRILLKKFARQSGMFDQQNTEYKRTCYLNRIEKNLRKTPLRSNYFLHYCFGGEYKNYVPYPYEVEIQEHISCAESKISVISEDLLDHLKSTPNSAYTKFNLSDVFEPLSIDANKQLWHEIIRTAKDGAKIIYWNNLVKRTYPDDISQYIETDLELTELLNKRDRVYFYDRLYTHTIRK